MAIIASAAQLPEYCGLPMLIPGESLVLEPRHPAKDMYAKLETQEIAKHRPDILEDIEADKEYEGWKVVNIFYSHIRQSFIHVLRRPDGTTTWGLAPAIHNLRQQLSTMACSVAWSIESESKALRTLAQMIPHHAFKYYLLTGIFLEQSQRSGVRYMFRKLRPTVALGTGLAKDGGMKIIASLCMHPIGYYADSWAGAMCPTDDVLAHLLMMRGDEHMFWKRCNQHPAWHPAAGL